MSQLVVSELTAKTGVNATTLTTAALTHTFLNDGNTFLLVKTTSTEITVTVETPAHVSGLDIEEVAVVIPAASTFLLGNFDPGVYNQIGGVVNISLSVVTGASIGAFRLPG